MSLFAAVEVIHQLQIRIEARCLDIAQGKHRLDVPVVATDVRQVCLAVGAGGRIDIDAHHVVKLGGEVVGDARTYRDIAEARLGTSVAGGANVQVHDRGDGMKQQLAVQQLLVCHPDHAVPARLRGL